MEGHGVTPRPLPYRAAEMVNRVLFGSEFRRPRSKGQTMAKNNPLRRGGNDQVLVQIFKPNFMDMLFMVHRGCLTTRARY